jgi:hypothetical protein
VVLYGSETWSLTLRGEHRLKVSENRVLRIFGRVRDEVMGGWRNLYNKELRNLDEIGGACSVNWGRRGKQKRK